MTTKYKHLTFLVSFGVQLAIYLTLVVYPISLVLSKVEPKWLWVVQLNPLTNVFEVFRYSFLGSGTYSFMGLPQSLGVAIFMFLFGLVILNRTERIFIDME